MPHLTCGCIVRCEPEGIEHRYDCEHEFGVCWFEKWISEHLRCKICGKCINCFPDHSNCYEPFVVDGDADLAR